MEITFLQALLMGSLYFLIQSGTPWLTAFIGNYIRQPLVNGFIVGLIMGRPVEGLIIGSAINLPYIGVFMVGSTMPTDSALAGIVGTAFALSTGASPELAMTVSVPIGLLGNFLWPIHMTKNSIFVRWMDKAAEEGDIDRIASLNVWWPQITSYFLFAIPITVLIYYGITATTPIIESLDGMPLHIMETLGGALAALGIGMTLKTLLQRKNTILFYLTGFILASYFNLPMIPLAVLGVVIAYVYSEFKAKIV